MATFDSEEDLEVFENGVNAIGEHSFMHGCPVYKTDDYLMDL